MSFFMNLLSKNGALFFLALLFVPQYQIKADSYPLSPESKTKIAIAAAIGSLIGGGLGYIAYSNSPDVNNPQKKNNNKRGFWNKIANSALPFVAIPAIVGAAAAGLITYYYFTPEKIRELQDAVAKKIREASDLKLAEYDSDLKALEVEFKYFETTNIEELKAPYASSDFPIINVRNRLYSLDYALKEIKEGITESYQKGSEYVIAVAQTNIEKINHFRQVITQRLVELRKDVNFEKQLESYKRIISIDEVARVQRMMADAADRQARAAEMQARAAIIQAHNQKPPVVVVHTRN